MKIVCISDTHCNLRKVKLPDGDILVHAGDALSRGTLTEFMKFVNELDKLRAKYLHIIYVPGNHDMITEQNEDLVKQECAARNIIYLNNTGITLGGIKFWGSGVTPRFHNWAWNRDSGDCGTSYHHLEEKYDPIQPYWDMIPDDTDVIITHGPPSGVMDVSIYSMENCGCKHLLNRVLDISPKYHIFGHIHNWHGIDKIVDTTFVNAAICTEQYDPTNEPIVVEI